MSTPNTDGAETIVKKDDGTLALVILVAALAIVVATGIYLWRSKKFYGSVDNR